MHLCLVLAVAINARTIGDSPRDSIICGSNSISIMFTRVSGEEECEVRVSDASNKTNGLILINSLSSSSIYCLNPGYYYIGCKGAGIINIRYLDVTPDNEYNVNHDLTEYPHWKVLRLEQTEVHIHYCSSVSQEA